MTRLLRLLLILLAFLLSQAWTRVPFIGLPALRAQTPPSEPVDTKTVIGDTRGKEFWVAFPKNAIVEHSLSLKLFITSDKSTSGVVSIPGLGKRTSFHVNPSEIIEIAIDSLAQIINSEMVQKLGVHV